MAFNQRVFRKDKAKPVKLRTVCEFTPLENTVRNNSVQPIRSPGVSRANADYLISNGGENINNFSKGERDEKYKNGSNFGFVIGTRDGWVSTGCHDYRRPRSYL